ncbi:MAG: hypothetical protein WD757_07155 [Actinomycetota bacterium]
MNTNNTGRTGKARWAFAGILATIVGTVLALGPTATAGAGEVPATNAQRRILGDRLSHFGAKAPAARLRAAAQTGGAEIFLYGIDAFGTKGAFAVGDILENGAERPSARMYNGRRWNPVPVQDPGVMSGLTAVSAISAKRAYAVGFQMGSTVQPLIEQFNGASFSTMPSPDVPGGMLLGVDAISATDVYAVGLGPSGQLIEHFDGNAWSVVPGPALPQGMLVSVQAVSPSNVWAVGAYRDGDVFKTLIQHFDGNAWTVVDSPAPDAKRSMLSSVSVVTANDIWAVGYTNPTGGAFQDKTLIMHYDGKTWTQVSSPNLGHGKNALWSVDAVRAGNVWAVGETAGGTLIQHYDGKRWTIDSRTRKGTESGETLYGVAAASKKSVFAIGGCVEDSGTNSMEYYAMVNHFNGNTWLSN